MDPDLLSILACPETKKDLELADEVLIKKVNSAIEDGKLVNKSLEKVSKKIDAGLMRVGDSTSLYPVRDGIPILLVDELINIEAIN